MEYQVFLQKKKIDNKKKKNRIERNFQIYKNDTFELLSNDDEIKQMFIDLGIKKNTRNIERICKNPFNLKTSNLQKKYIPGRTLSLDKLYLYHKLKI